MTIRSRFGNLQHQRNKGGERKDAGHAFVAYAGGRLGGKHYSPTSTQGHGKGRRGYGRGGRKNHDNEEGKEQHKTTSGKAVKGKADSAKGNSAQCKRYGETTQICPLP